jgi:hypothetical protein
VEEGSFESLCYKIGGYSVLGYAGGGQNFFEVVAGSSWFDEWFFLFVLVVIFLFLVLWFED